eukprot:gb/GEZN01001599.1/.p1 GENE.gb/GEZN01001599.1/~~gb/GEZN01001599.1/.p1  ORF type:complete len:436 (+),score=46.19 gb/GEZN01001599.1/:252-1559(+)
MNLSPDRQVAALSKSSRDAGRASFNSPARKRVLGESKLGNARPQKLATRMSPRTSGTPKMPKSPRKRRVPANTTRQLRTRWSSSEEGERSKTQVLRESRLASTRSRGHSPIANLTSKPTTLNAHTARQAARILKTSAASPSPRPLEGVVNNSKTASSLLTKSGEAGETDTDDEIRTPTPEGQVRMETEETQETSLVSSSTRGLEDTTSGDTELDLDYSPLIFMKNLPPLPPMIRAPALPRRRSTDPSHCLVLDLDETLVHCSVQPIDKPDLTFAFNFDSNDYQVYVRTRPHLFEFLQQVGQWYEIVVFTASYSEYASTLLDLLDPEHTYIKHRLFRRHCINVEGNFLKDLNVLGRDLHRVALMDNSVLAFGYQVDNGIPIQSWLDDPQDKELLNMLPFLETMKDLDDVRPLIRNTFRIQEYLESLPDTAALPDMS